MKLYLAGSFGGRKLRLTLYAAHEATDILLSAGWENSRETAEILSNGQERMKLFIAGNREPLFQNTVCTAAGKFDMLASNANKSAQEVADDFVQRYEYHLLIDSGAFTAWKQGKPIDLADYIAYAQRLSDGACCDLEFIALDVIAGSYDGPAPTCADRAAACQKGYENWKAMEAAGVPCIPTYHRGDEHFLDEITEDWYWLKKLASEVKAGGRLCLAPKADGSHVEVKMNWINKCFRELEAINKEENTGLEIWQRWRIHGLGISSQPIMEAYPWYSVDSTGWLFSLTSLAYRYFDGSTIQARQKKDRWRETACGHLNKCEHDDAISLLCQEHNWPASNHKFTYNPPPLFEEHAEIPLCEVCSKPAQGHEEAKEELPDGYYWFGTEAIKADVALADHVTRHWQRRGVYFDEERLCEPDPKADAHWRNYEGSKNPEQQPLDHSQENNEEQYGSTIAQNDNQMDYVSS